MAAQPIEDLAVLLEGLGYANVMRWQLQDAPDEAVAIAPHDTTTTGRGKSEFVFGQTAPARGHFRLLVSVRGAPENPEAAGQRAFALWTALHRQLETINGAAYRTVTPTQTPVALPVDARRRSIYVFHVDAYPESL